MSWVDPQSASPGVAPMAKPPPADPGFLDPDWIIEIVPGTSPPQAESCANLSEQIVLAALWPNPLPDPVPQPVTMAGLSIGCRLALAGVGGTPEQAASGRVVSESLGAYSYRLAASPAVEGVFQLTDVERRLLGPWMTASRVYQLDTGPDLAGLPFWWFQYDLDRPDDTGTP